MKILIVAGESCRGAAENLVWGLSTYSENEVRGLCRKTTRWPLSDWDPDKYWDVDDPEAVDEAIEWSDICHFVHACSFRSIGRPDHIGQKPAIWQMFTQWNKGSRRRTNWYDQLWEEDDHRHVHRALIAEGWDRYNLWEGLTYTLLPMIFPIDTLLVPLEPAATRFKRVSFTAMSRSDRVVAPKGVRPTLVALRKIPVDFCYRRPWEECIGRKSRSWIGIDEVVTPIFHFSGFEYLAVGVPCISRFDTISERSLKSVTGAMRIPFINASFDSLRQAVEVSLSFPEERWQEQRDEARSWMIGYYHPRDMVRHYDWMYRHL
jgi:hypothetical protein